MSLLSALVLALAALLAGYYMGIGRREADTKPDNAEILKKINSAIERLTKELCGDYEARALNAKMFESGLNLEFVDVKGGALDRVASAAEGIARNLYDLKQVLNTDATKRSS